MKDVASLTADAIRREIDLANAKLRVEHYYSCLPLCIIDSVFSIGVNYEGTRRTVRRWCEAQEPQWPLDRRETDVEYTVSEFVGALHSSSVEHLAERTFENRQRTSSKSGILKAEAVLKFAEALKSVGIETLNDVGSDEKVAKAEKLIRQIPGQGSGISFSYFMLLAGSDDEVKPDRMIIRFVARAIGVETVSVSVAKQAIIGAARILQSEYPHVTPRLLDSEVWGLESAKVRGRLAKEATSNDDIRQSAAAETIEAKGQNGRLTLAGIEAVNAAFQSGATVTEIAQKFGLSYPAAQNRKRLWEQSRTQVAELQICGEYESAEPSAFQVALPMLLTRATEVMKLRVPDIVDSFEATESRLNSRFASAWIGVLSEVLKDHFKSLEVRSCAEDFQPELLFDLVVAQTGYVVSPVHNKNLPFLHHPVLVAENEFAVSTRDVLYDLQKLAFAGSSEKLLITAERNDPEGFLRSLSPCAKKIQGELATAFVAHPRKWLKGIAIQGAWRWTGETWEKITEAQ